MLVHDSNATSLQKVKAIHGVVCRVPSGTVATYGQIAAMAGLPGRARLVGKALACVLNQHAIPWHRIIRSDGKIAFPAESEQAMLQAALLRKEGVVVNNGVRVNLRIFQWQPDSLWQEVNNDEN